MDIETLKAEALRTLATLAFLTPPLVAFGYWLATGRSILTLLGW